MSVRAAVVTFPARSGTGTQTVTGIQDGEGSFTGKLFLFQCGYAVINTVTAPGFPFNFYMDMRGAHLGAAIGSGGSASSAVLADTDAGFKDTAGGAGNGYCLIDYTAQPSFGGVIHRKAYISAIADGSFTLTYDLNDRTGDDILCTVLGGDDLTIEAISNIGNGTHTLSDKPQGVYCGPYTFLGTALTTATATGAGPVNWGWTTRDGDQGANSLIVLFTGPNNSRQFTNRLATSITTAGTAVDSTPIVSAWNDTSVAITGNGPDVISTFAFAFGGTNIRAAAGIITQPTSTGVQTFDTGINAKWITFISTGYPSSTSLQTPDGATTMGWGVRTLDQVGWWAGSSGTGTLTGARYESDNSVLRFGTANTTSTTFTAVAALTALNSDGTASINWTTADSTQRQILWFALGEEVQGPIVPSFHTTTFVRRRLRRSPIVWSEKQGLQTNVRVNLIAVDMQPGVSTQVDTPDAQVMIRASKNGGRTWTSERFISVGAIGAYTQRLNTWRWGQGRQWVVEVSTSDPVVFNLVQLFIDAEPGTS